MRQPKPSRTTTPNETAADSSRPNGSLRLVLLGGLIALFVAAPLVPGEAAADLGSGIPLVLLLLIVAWVWLVAGMLHGELVARFEPIGTALMLLAGWLAVSAAVMAPAGTPRPAINVVWEWIAFVVGYRMCLQLVRSSAERRAICAVMASLAVGLSVYGFYQCAVVLPQQRADYHQASAAEQADLREEAGIFAPEGSPQVEHFVQRINSREPWATFGLTNSLAGFLVPWFVVLAGVTLDGFFDRTSTWHFRLAGPCGLIGIGGCMLLTKSRAAWLAALVAVVVVLWSVRGKLDRRVVLAGGTAFVLVIIVVFLSGGIDWEVISEAPKSLGYRVEYWRATAALIADHFWLGCGPGNFQEYYLQYKLPQASEEIKDPHNFVLEVWAIGGLPAIALLGIALFGFFILLVRRSSIPLDPETQTPAAGSVHAKTIKTGLTSTAGARSIYAGGLCGLTLGLILAWMAGFWPSGLIVTGIPCAIVFAWLLYGWVCHGEVRTWQLAVGVYASLFNLLFAGGIGFSGVAGSVWLLMALSLAVPHASFAWTTVPRSRVIASVALVFALLGACYVTAYRPVLTRSDRWDPDPWKRQASRDFQQWLVNQDKDSFAAFESALSESIRLDARSTQIRRQAALFYLWAAAIKNEVSHAQEATRHLQRATQWYPFNAMVHAEFAWSLHLAGDDQRAAAEAAESLRLDSINPHQELKLRNRRLFDEPEDNRAKPGVLLTRKGVTAEHCMQQLRNTVGSS